MCATSVATPIHIRTKPASKDIALRSGIAFLLVFLLAALFATVHAQPDALTRALQIDGDLTNVIQTLAQTDSRGQVSRDKRKKLHRLRSLLYAALTDALSSSELTSSQRATALQRRARLHISRDDLSLALKDASASLLVRPEDASALLLRASLHDLLNHHQLALDDYNAAFELGLEHPLFHQRRGELRYKLGRLEGAKKDYEDHLRSNPNDYETFERLGDVYLEQGNPTSALSEYYKSLAALDRVHRPLRGTSGSVSMPRKHDLYALIGEVHAQKREWKHALESFRNAIEADPDIPRAYADLSRMYSGLGDGSMLNPSLAVKYAKQAQYRNRTQDPIVYAAIAEVHYAAKDFEAASDAIRQGLLANPQHEVLLRLQSTIGLPRQ